MNKINNNVDTKLFIKLILGTFMAILDGVFFRETYVRYLYQQGVEHSAIQESSLFFWTLIGVCIGFVIGFFIIFLFTDIVVMSYNNLKLFIQGRLISQSYIIDSSTIMDGRIQELVQIGLFNSRIYVSSITLDELNRLEKVSKIYARRVEKGRRVLDSLKNILGKHYKKVNFVNPPKTIREHIIAFGKNTNSTIITLDASLTDEARNAGLTVININELSLALRVQMASGDSFNLKLVRPGKEKNQAVGYLDDGMMVIVENGFPYLHKNVEVECVSVLQSTSGKIVFGKLIRELAD